MVTRKMTRRRSVPIRSRAARRTGPWNGMCPAGRHGLDYHGQACDVYAHDAGRHAARSAGCRACDAEHRRRANGEVDVAEVRSTLRVTQRDLAILLGMHDLTVSRWERGLLRPTRHQAALLRAASGAVRNCPEIGAIVTRALVDAGVAVALHHLLRAAFELPASPGGSMTERQQIEAVRDAVEEACDRWEAACDRREAQAGLARPAPISTDDAERARIASLRGVALQGFRSGDYCHVCGRVGSHESNELSAAQRLAHEAEDASQHR